MFKLVSDYLPSGDQPKAISNLTKGIIDGLKSQVLLGATATGKTFTIANVINQTQKRTLVLAHNKTLASQLYSELKGFFPENKVEYFVSYFDFYQPEAYLPKTDSYIEKSSVTNQEIEVMRLSTLTSLTNEQDVIVVGSVAAIYPCLNPIEFEQYNFSLIKNHEYDLIQLVHELVKLGYKRNQISLTPGTFSLHGDVLKIAPGYSFSHIYRLSFDGNNLEFIHKLEPLNLKIIESLATLKVTAAFEYFSNQEKLTTAIKTIRDELAITYQQFMHEGKIIEANRIKQRTEYDINQLVELGYCNGVENYARHLELRSPNSTPFTLFDFFGDDWLLVIDESHMTIPQIKGMYNTDLSRKQSLINYGFRLPSAIDNRPLNFCEFNQKIRQVIYVSATPNDYEINEADGSIIEQIVRPTGLVDPIIEIRKTTGQIEDLYTVLKEETSKQGKIFITVLTIRLAEELSEYLRNQKFKTAFLHNELKIFERDKVLSELRKGIYDVIVGVNLLREGIDIPEISLVVIFDADKPGFFRGDKALIQIIGRAARNVNGRVIMYADEITNAMEKAVLETERRRKIQLDYNQKNCIKPKTIIKPINYELLTKNKSKVETIINWENKFSEKTKQLEKLRKEMMKYARKQEYELAASIRDLIIELEAKQ